ncbi:uncharacterized protein Dwil_GK11621 [Drosophila willistoni]|uniref:Uncharacterized protein n=1 Tax=Drosophila willistoni TaxID=7260 RepID=B4N9P6_DROWI|nr:phosphate-regulating neutral endopeptidase PHEX [Drosophila willistoni]EDW80611.1 uncharacterized protein Dwil_GK11621 [Drosophila willistoni]
MKATIGALLLLCQLINVNVARQQQGNMNRNSLMSQGQAPNYQHPNLNPDSREEFRVRQQMSLDVQKYLNLSVNPCEDFFEYACGRWPSFHQRELQRQSNLTTAQQLVESHIVDQLQQLFAKPLTEQRHGYSSASTLSVRKVRDFYESCRSVPGNAKERRRFLMKILSDNGGLRNVPNSNWQPNRPWLQTLAELRRNYGLDILIGMEVDLNLQQMRGNSIYFGEPKLTIIPAEHCNVRVTRGANIKDQVYEELQLQVAANLRDWLALSESESERMAGDVISFEFELCKHMGAHHFHTMGQNPVTPINYGARSRTGQDRLQRQRGGLSLTDLTLENGNKLDFKMYVELVLEGPYNGVVFQRSQDYIKHLVLTTRTKNAYTIVSYFMYVALQELNQPPEDHPTQRLRQCVQVVQRLFPEVVGHIYQQEVQRDDAKSDLEQIFSDLVKAFDQQLRVEWMDENDRRAARTKLSQYRIIFPDYQSLDLAELHFQKEHDYWRKLETSLRYRAREKLNRLRGNDFGQDADGLVEGFEVRAALVARQQSVLVGWGLLQMPFYSYFYPKALKYALLGQRLASALIRAFDNEGWNHYPQSTSPWNELTMSGYRNVSECQRVQYSNYLYDHPEEFRNITRLREIMTESSGLNVAFNAYLAWLEQQQKLLYRETLPELDYTNTQLFFIYFAQTRCWARSVAVDQEDQDEEQVSLDQMPLVKHTPERWDINGPLANSEEFGREFNCALGTPMNNGDKCLLY